MIKLVAPILDLALLLKHRVLEARTSSRETRDLGLEAQEHGVVVFLLLLKGHERRGRLVQASL